MKYGGGSQKLTLLLSIIYLFYAFPATVSLGHPSDTMYLFSHSHTPVSENFPKSCEKKRLTCSQMINNLRDLWLKSCAYTEGSNTRNLVTTCSNTLPAIEETIILKSIKMDSLNSSSSWQTIKVALIEAL